MVNWPKTLDIKVYVRKKGKEGKVDLETQTQLVVHELTLCNI